MIRTTLLRWMARLLLTPLVEAVDWDDVDVAARFDQARLEAALDWDDVVLQKHVGDDRLAGALNWDAIDVYDYVDEHKHLSGPVEVLHELDDDHEDIYVWEVETVEAEGQVSRQIHGEYQREYGREPRAAHFVVADLESLREFDPDQLAAYVDPQKVGGGA
jgi:hypothetical protein